MAHTHFPVSTDMIRVENIRMRDKLAAVLVLPLIALTLLAGYTLSQEIRHQAGMTQLARAGELILGIGNLVHELQAERGRTGLYLSGQNESLMRAQADQRALTDKAWRELDAERVQGILPSGYLDERHGELGRLRAQVDQRTLSTSQAIEAYSLLVRNLISHIEGLADVVQDTDVARQISAFHALIRAKEAAGRERVEGGRWLSNDADPAQEARLVEFTARQTLWLELFESASAETMLRVWRTASQASCVRDMEALRGAMHAKGAKPSNQQWFETASCRMERLHDVEIAYAHHLANLTGELYSASRQRLALILLAALLPIFPSIWLILLVARNVSGHSRWLLTSMQGIARGNFNVSLPPASRDELGQLAMGLDELRQQLAQHVHEQDMMLRRERDMAAELERRGREVQIFAQQVAAGDLTGRLQEGDDAMGRLAADLNHMVEGLSGLAGRVRETGNSLVVTVSQLHDAVAGQSSGASEQAASVSQTVTTLEQIRATSAQTLGKARLLGEMAERARSEGEHGRQVVEESIVGMSEVNGKVDAIARTILSLNEQTQRVGEITGAVSAIARQLRLLSLNAAIEATKAGEAGHGFTVVAGEVKQLAEQSQQATEQVQRILQEIRHATDRAVMTTEDGAKGVVHGLELVQRAGQSIRGLEQVVRDTSLASSQIVAAVRQESAGIEQIATAMRDIHKVTAQFVTAGEQTRNATEELSHLSQRLSQAAGNYRL